jgi:hypothetical protein
MMQRSRLGLKISRSHQPKEKSEGALEVAIEMAFTDYLDISVSCRYPMARHY